MKTFRRRGALRSALAQVVIAVFAVLPVWFMVNPTILQATAASTFSTPDMLPTAQIDGIVWAQVTVGNTVYATGRFNTARPAGAALGDASTVSRGGIVAFDIRTGVLSQSFAHSLSGYTGESKPTEGRALAVSPDGSRLYLGGSFNAVDGQPRNNLAAFDTASGNLLPNIGVIGTSSTIKALAATNTTVYAGGGFTKANNQPRAQLAAFDNNGTLLPWAPSANGQVAAMVMSPDYSKVIVGGSFSMLNGSTYHALGAIDAGSGAPVAWASQNDSFPIRDESPSDSAGGITSLSTNGSMIFLTAFDYAGSGSAPFEGRAAISATDGHLIWLNDCHGDSYSAVPIGNVLYSVSHAHDCQPAGDWPETDPRTTRRALAESINPSGVNGPATNGYHSYAGQPRSDQLDWYPVLNTGSVSGSNQGAWSITGNSAYLSLGGEFTKVNGIAQQGLVRFAVTPLALTSYAQAAAAARQTTATTPAATTTQAAVSETKATTIAPANTAKPTAVTPKQDGTASEHRPQIINTLFQHTSTVQWFWLLPLTIVGAGIGISIYKYSFWTLVLLIRIKLQLYLLYTKQFIKRPLTHV